MASGATTIVGFLADRVRVECHSTSTITDGQRQRLGVERTAIPMLPQDHPVPGDTAVDDRLALEDRGRRDPCDWRLGERACRNDSERSPSSVVSPGSIVALRGDVVCAATTTEWVVP
jgi:hypothetical protein